VALKNSVGKLSSLPVKPFRIRVIFAVAACYLLCHVKIVLGPLLVSDDVSFRLLNEGLYYARNLKLLFTLVLIQMTFGF